MSVYIDFEKLKELCDKGAATVVTHRDSLTNEFSISISTMCDPFIEFRKEKEKMPPLSWEKYPSFDYRKFFESSCKTNKNKIKKVIFNKPMTIIIWEDGEKTYARTVEGDEYDPFRGFLLCYAKKKLRKEVTQYKDFLFNMDSKGRYFIEHLIKGKYKNWETYKKEVIRENFTPYYERYITPIFLDKRKGELK